MAARPWCSWIEEYDHRHCGLTGRANARPMAGSAKQTSDFGDAVLDCFVADAPLRKRFAFVAGNDDLKSSLPPLVDRIETLPLRTGRRLRRCGRRGRIGVGRRFKALALPLLHVLLIFRRAASGWHVRRQATGPLRKGIAHAGPDPLIDRTAASKHKRREREREDEKGMVNADRHLQDVTSNRLQKRWI